MKYIITESNKRRVQFIYLDYLLEDMYKIKVESYSRLSYVFMIKENRIMQLEKSGNLEVISPIWDKIERGFTENYEETQELIKDWFEQRLGFEGVKPKQVDFF